MTPAEVKLLELLLALLAYFASGSIAAVCIGGDLACAWGYVSGVMGPAVVFAITLLLARVLVRIGTAR